MTFSTKPNYIKPMGSLIALMVMGFYLHSFTAIRTASGLDDGSLSHRVLNLGARPMHGQIYSSVPFSPSLFNSSRSFFVAINPLPHSFNTDLFVPLVIEGRFLNKSFFIFNVPSSFSVINSSLVFDVVKLIPRRLIHMRRIQNEPRHF